MSPHADHIRGLTVFNDNRAGVDDKTVKVELCPGARVYDWTISVRTTADPIPDIIATLQLQDSKIEIPSYGCAVAEITHVFPGVAWPAFAKLIAPPGSFVTLHVSYGHCA